MARGFASLNQNRRREIASKGGKIAHAKGTAHEWSPEEAREAGRRGAIARRKSLPASTASNKHNAV
jgi:general stress protein YciG